jgi:hypothetical protein
VSRKDSKCTLAASYCGGLGCKGSGACSCSCWRAWVRGVNSSASTVWRVATDTDAAASNHAMCNCRLGWCLFPPGVPTSQQHRS